jgi:hypothetical protein
MPAPLLAALLLFGAPPKLDFYANGPYDSNVPRPDSLLGYDAGDRITTYHDQDRVVNAIASRAGLKVRMMPYGKSVQGRPLRVFAISSATNIARLAPGFEAQFSWLALGVACISTVAWGKLVHWRVGRHRRELWRSLVLPAGGIAWCWTLMMTMGISLFDYTQSYERWAPLVAKHINAPGCVRAEQLNIGEIAALRWIGKLPIGTATLSNDCSWLLVPPGPNQSLPAHIDTAVWADKALVLHPADSSIGVWVLQRR